MIWELLQALVGALFFGTAGLAGVFIGEAFCDRLAPLPDAPPQVKVPPAALVAACAAIGACIALRGAGGGTLLATAITCIALAAIWVTDARRGIVPDIFTLGPLAILAAIALTQQHWTLFISAAITFVPFAAMAAVSRGKGLGWGDVKLAALGGAVLGVELAILAFVIASFTAAAMTFARGRKGETIAFAPYMASAIALALPLGFRV